MRRKNLILSAALAACALAIVVAIARAPSQPAAPGPGTAPDTRGAQPGQDGGVVLTQGRLAANIQLSEKPGDARLVVVPLVDGKPVATGAAVSGTLTRYDGSRIALRFTQSAARFTSEAAIAKPHVFDAAIEVKADGMVATFAFSRTDGAIALTGEQIGAARIGVAQAGPAQIVDSFQLPGEIKFNEDRTAHIVPRVAGVVERVGVSVGEQVSKGQVLAVIASTDLSDRRSELLTAQKRLTGARQVYEREKKLWEERISAEQDYQAAQVQLREAEIAVQNAQQKLSAINAPASGALNRYELRAPFAGTIVEKHVAPGEAVSAEANLFVLADLSTVWAEMAVPPQRLGDVRVGKQATVSAAAFESQARGQIAYVGALLGAQTRTAPARVVLPNPGSAWRPGMFVNVAVDAGAQTVPVAVETDALQTVDGQPTVFVESKRGFVAQPVEIGRRDGKRTEIVGGLAAGQRYAAANSFVLKADLEKSAADD
ncbi:efflux RND transporter periplasmic adaptor subunit [Burkholderia sp. TSV86]|uniref:efflux RND transporter periplasmic adaptor subunit n=1 Tax=Burkholderia sp. TSV86 TaxID=1385594 RepID=UPI00075E47CF|nr:efflux RND transporter periplasmic adaptor subunit [Burkholderia sp. TSV86]KVE32694.1 hemolysin D [Burkholderia sp. TSV86]